MRYGILFTILFIALYGRSQAGKSDALQTVRYAGVYSFGKNIEEGPVGSVIIYPETDTTILFYMDLCRGAPSYNLGQMYSRVKIVGGGGMFSEKNTLEDIGCKWQINFSKNELIIKTIDEQNNCGFGYAVHADGIFKRKSSKTPRYFIDGHGNKHFFKDTKSEEYFK